jgi:tetratricopeptide (TPR) repeat protein
LLPGPGSLALVTARTRFALPNLSSRTLGALSDDDAVALIRRIEPRAEGIALEMSALCGGLPLALRIAASALAERPDLSPDDYLRRLHRAGPRLDLVASSLSASHALLPDDLAAHWCALGVFDGVFDAPAAAQVWGGSAGNDLEAAPAADSAPLEDDDLEAAMDVAQDRLSELVRRSLVWWDEARKRYRLHDLVRLYARQHMDAPVANAAARRHARYYAGVLGKADDLYLDPKAGPLQGLALCDDDWANITAGQAWAAENTAADAEAARLAVVYPEWGAHCLALRLRPEGHLAWLEAALAASRQLRDREGEGYVLGNLGTVSYSLGEFERALEYHSAALALARERDDQRNAGVALDGLGNALTALGEMDEAVDCYGEALELARGLGDRRGEGSRLGNLGNAYLAAGQTQQALACHEAALEISQETGDRHGEASDLGNLGNVYYALGDYDLAAECHEASRALAEELGDRGGAGTQWGNLGTAHFARGDLAAAAECYERGLEIAREVGNAAAKGSSWATWATPTTAWATRAGATVLPRRPGGGPGHRRPPLRGPPPLHLALLRRTQGDLWPPAARPHAANILAELGRESEAERARKLLDEVGRGPLSFHHGGQIVFAFTKERSWHTVTSASCMKSTRRSSARWNQSSTATTSSWPWLPVSAPLIEALYDYRDAEEPFAPPIRRWRSD